jgi:DNA polymerase-3 subunit epsilon
MVRRRRAHRVRAWAQGLSQAPWCVVDTETTGLGGDAEIVQIAVIDGPTGDLLFDRDVRPAGPPGGTGGASAAGIEAEALAVHGLDACRLAAAPPWPDVLSELRPFLAGRRIVAYNAEFDRRLCHQTCDRYRLPRPRLRWECAMRRYSDWTGHWRSLAAACAAEGIPFAGGAPHTAAGDAAATWLLVRRIAEAAVLRRGAISRVLR